MQEFPNAVERLRTDGGGEYAGVKEAEHVKTTLYTSEHNPLVERTNKSVMNPWEQLTEQAKLSAKYLLEAAKHVGYMKNRPSHSAFGCSKYEQLY